MEGWWSSDGRGGALREASGRDVQAWPWFLTAYGVFTPERPVGTGKAGPSAPLCMGLLLGDATVAAEIAAGWECGARRVLRAVGGEESGKRR